MRRFLICLVSCLMVWSLIGGALGEDEHTFMTVIASQLNGRAYPTTKSVQEAFFDYGDRIEATGKWSDDYQWVEVVGSESGTTWCKAQYLTERTESFTVINEGRKAVKIRKSPVDGKVVGYLKAGKTLKISQVILGWGKCQSGWIDLEYLCEDYD